MSAEARRGASPGASGLLAFGSLSALVGVGDILARGAREAVRLLASERIEVVVLGVETRSDRELAEFLGVGVVATEEEFFSLVERRGVPYWRTAAVGNAAAHERLLGGVSLPFWLSPEPFPGQRGVVYLSRIDAGSVAERLLGAWLPEGTALPRPREAVRLGGEH